MHNSLSSGLAKLNYNHLMPGEKVTNLKLTQLTVLKVERLINLLGDSIDKYISPKVCPMQSLAISGIDLGKCEVNI